MRKRKKRKFCPECGAELKTGDDYCIRCGYSFKKRKKKLNIKTIIILIVAFLVLWTIIRIITGKPVIPQTLIDIFTNNASG